MIVHPRVNERHPEISDKDVQCAWEGMVCHAFRIDRECQELIGVGMDSRGRLVEMVARKLEDGSWCVYHAMSPPSKKTLNELGLVKGKNAKK